MRWLPAPKASSATWTPRSSESVTVAVALRATMTPSTSVLGMVPCEVTRLCRRSSAAPWMTHAAAPPFSKIAFSTFAEVPVPPAQTPNSKPRKVTDLTLSL